MRTLLPAIGLSALVVLGCAGHRGGSAVFSDLPSSGRPSSSWPKEKIIVTPDTLLTGKVVKVNLDGRFVVLSFPIGHLPALEQRLSIYRHGLRMGEVRVTGPQLDDNVVGDIVAGDAHVGDDVRAQ